jgi:Arc/MetJ-type ribon-helix-helix transcriptional regulator
MVEITISLEEEVLRFLDRSANGNRSDYLNSLLTQLRRQAIEQEMIEALLNDAEDQDYLTEIAVWDCVAGDGID